MAKATRFFKSKTGSISYCLLKKDLQGVCVVILSGVLEAMDAGLAIGSFLHDSVDYACKKQARGVGMLFFEIGSLWAICALF